MPDGPPIPPPWPEDDGEEYELLPPDEEVLAGEKARHLKHAEELKEKVENDVTINFESPFLDLEFKFGVQDLLIFGGCLAVSLFTWVVADICFGFCIFLVSILVWLQFRVYIAEQVKAAKKEGLTAEEYARDTSSGFDRRPVFEDVDFSDIKKQFISYSVLDILIVTTIVAVLFAMIGWFDVGPTSGIFSVFVIGGGIAYIFGHRPSPKVWRIWFLVSIIFIIMLIVLALRKMVA